MLNAKLEGIGCHFWSLLHDPTMDLNSWPTLRFNSHSMFSLVSLPSTNKQKAKKLKDTWKKKSFRNKISFCLVCRMEANAFHFSFCCSFIQSHFNPFKLELSMSWKTRQYQIQVTVWSKLYWFKFQYFFSTILFFCIVFFLS